MHRSFLEDGELDWGSQYRVGVMLKEYKVCALCVEYGLN